MRLEEKVWNDIKERALIARGDGVVVGFSGGADSTALLHVLHRLRKRGGWTVTAAHLNHGLRGKESDGDERFAKRFAKKLKVEFVSAKLPTGALRGARGLSPEEAARDARMAFLEEVRRRLGARFIALAHHRDDQAETVLFRFLRGASLRGLGGMDLAAGAVIRPMLDAAKDEIIAYCRENDIRFRQDSSNRDPRFPRNRIRRDLLPLIEKEINPNVRERLAHTAALLRRDNDFLETLAREHLARCRAGATGGRLTLRLRELTLAPPQLLDRVWMAALFAASETAARKIDSRHLSELNARLAAGKKGIVSLPGGLAAEFTAKNVELGDAKRLQKEKQ